MITSHDEEGAAKAKAWVENIVKEVMVGEIYEGKVIQIVKDKIRGSEIGAIVELLPGKDGMVHISEVDHTRINKVTDKINVGDVVKVKVVEIDKEKNRTSLSIKALLPRPAFSDTLKTADNFSDRSPRTESRDKKPFFKKFNK